MYKATDILNHLHLFHTQIKADTTLKTLASLLIIGLLEVLSQKTAIQDKLKGWYLTIFWELSSLGKKASNSDIKHEN